MTIRSAVALAIIGALAGGAFWASAATAQIEAVNLQPLTDWEVEQEADRCIVRRSFGDPSAPTIVEMRSIDPWTFGYQTAVLSERYSPTGEAFQSVWLPGGAVENNDRFTLIEGVNSARGVLFLLGMARSGNEPRVIGRDGPFDLLGIDPADLPADGSRFAEVVEGFLLVDAFDSPLFIATGPMQSVFDAREPCINRVLASQGVDPADARRGDYRLEMTNRLQLAERIMSRVPRALRQRTRPAYVGFLLYVDGQAQPTSCRMVSLPYDEQFEQRSCETLIERAQFEFNVGEAAQPTFYKFSSFVAPWGCSGQMRCD